ncbi:MAG: LysM peptidoglycan-binding domain-containing protein, partial [Bacilli bacterium]|nr:LysM peptidoglycan-binding domain-containing protein [Bacilli bacterium]
VTNYTVSKGDTLYSIARKFNTSVDSIKSLNNLTSNTLSIGQVIKIPFTGDGTTSSNVTNYTVSKGDTLYSIARKFNTSVDSIKSLNNLTSNTLSIGQVIKISSTGDGTTSSNVKNYTVSKGDTLYSIARKFNTSVDSIKSLNNLTSNTLSIGQIIKISSTGDGTTSSNVTNYTVSKGDTLYSIAKKFNTSVDNIKSLNNLTNNTLSIGQTLKVSS